MYKNLILNFLVCGTLERQEMLIYQKIVMGMRVVIYIYFVVYIFVYMHSGRFVLSNKPNKTKNLQIFANVMVDSTKYVLCLLRTL